MSKSPYIIIKNYEHYNKAFRNWDCSKGRYIGSRADYERAMREEGMITEREAERQGMSDEGKRKEYKVSADTLALIESVKQTADKRGRIKPGERAVEALKSKFNYNASVCPEHYKPEGGFSEDKE